MELTGVVQLMFPSFCLCVLMVGMLSYLGIHVIKREIIFVDLALAQIAALGALVALLLGIPLHTQASYWFSVALTALAAAVFALSRTRESRVPQEAIIGLVYAIAAAAAIILIDKAPHGAEHIKDILTGSILWVKWQTVALVAAVYALVGVFHFVFRHNFMVISEDVEKAHSKGLNVGLWDFLFYLSFGVVITVSVGSAGVLLVFVLLVAPAVMAAMITSRLFHQLVFGWALGLAAIVTGLVVSYAADLSSGPLVIGAYAVALIVVSAVVYIARADDRARAAARTACVAASFAAGLALLFGVGRAIGSRFGAQPHAHLDHPVADTPGDHSSTSHDDLAAHPSGAEPSDTDEAGARLRFETMLDASDDPFEQADIVSQALAADPTSGAALAIRFLAHDPPDFFAQSVVDELDALLSEPSGFVVSQPFDHPVNQQAAARVRAHLGLAD